MNKTSLKEKFGAFLCAIGWHDWIPGGGGPTGNQPLADKRGNEK